jgi:hypothetical protein
LEVVVLKKLLRPISAQSGSEHQKTFSPKLCQALLLSRWVRLIDRSLGTCAKT